MSDVKRIFCAVSAAAIVLLASCSGGGEIPLVRRDFLFDTIVSISLYGVSDSAAGEKVLDGAFHLCIQYDALLSKTSQSGDVWRINNAGGAAVQVSPETAWLLELAGEYYRLSGGLFDITCGAETALWDFHTDEHAVPTDEQLAEAADRTGYDFLHIEGQTVWLDEGAQIDLGGIAKGYIADQAAAFLREHLAECGATGALIDLGGNIVTVGYKKDGEPWSIAVRSPFGEDEYPCVLRLGEKSVVTSGTYERSFEVDGVLYHHILDPRTGMPARTDIASATVISGSSAEGDALSTVCLLLGSEDAVRLIDSLPGIDVIIITNDGQILRTDEKK